MLGCTPLGHAHTHKQTCDINKSTAVMRVVKTCSAFTDHLNDETKQHMFKRHNDMYVWLML